MNPQDVPLTSSSTHRLLMRGDPVSGKRTFIAPDSVLERILSITHFETPRKVIHFSVGSAPRLHHIETYTIDREEVRRVILRGLQYMVHHARSNVVLAAFAGYIKRHPTRILVSRQRGGLGSGLGATSQLPGEATCLTICLPTFIEPLTGRVQVDALTALLRSIQRLLWEVVISPSFLSRALDPCLRRDREFRDLFSRQRIPANQRAVWHAVVDEVENEPDLFGGPFDDTKPAHRRIMGREILIRLCEQMSQETSDVDLQRVAPYSWRFYYKVWEPALLAYAKAMGVPPLPVRERLPPLHPHMLVPVIKTVERRVK